MRAFRSTKWIPNPPSLQQAIDAGHVGVSDSSEGRAYIISRQCPNHEKFEELSRFARRWN
jgi:hypothetical protein